MASNNLVELAVEYPQRLSRLHLLLKSLLGFLYVGVPHGLILFCYGILVAIATFIAHRLLGYPIHRPLPSRPV